MPIYLYQHPKSKKVKQIIQGMNEPHVYSERNVEWTRVWTIPQAAIDTQADVFSENAYYHKLDNTKGSVGDAWERSAEWSNKRANKRDGKDPVKEKLYAEYAKKTKKPHPNAIKERVENLSVVI